MKVEIDGKRQFEYEELLEHEFAARSARPEMPFSARPATCGYARRVRIETENFIVCRGRGYWVRYKGHERNVWVGDQFDSHPEVAAANAVYVQIWRDRLPVCRDCVWRDRDDCPGRVATNKGICGNG